MVSPSQQPGYFATTHWSVVMAVGGDSPQKRASALECLCQAYWHPIYLFLRRQGRGPHDAQDLTQDFFARLLRLNSLESVSPDKGKFRTFLLASLKHFLADVHDANTAQKRGGGRAILSLDEQSAEELYRLEPSTDATPDLAFDRRWLGVTMEQALSRLKDEYVAAGKERHFAELKTFLEQQPTDGEYERVASALDSTTSAVAVAVHRLRQRYRDLVRAAIANTVSTPEEFAEELRHLLELHSPV